MDESGRILGRFVEDGRIHQLPAKQSKRLVILRWLAGRFTAGVDYAELEVNRLLSQFSQMQKMMKMMGKGGMQKMMRGARGMFPGLG